MASQTDLRRGMRVFVPVVLSLSSRRCAFVGSSLRRVCVPRLYYGGRSDERSRRTEAHSSCAPSRNRMFPLGFGSRSSVMDISSAQAMRKIRKTIRPAEARARFNWTDFSGIGDFKCKLIDLSARPAWQSRVSDMDLPHRIFFPRFEEQKQRKLRVLIRFGVRNRKNPRVCTCGSVVASEITNILRIASKLQAANIVRAV